MIILASSEDEVEHLLKRLGSIVAVIHGDKDADLSDDDFLEELETALNTRLVASIDTKHPNVTHEPGDVKINFCAEYHKE